MRQQFYFKIVSAENRAYPKNSNFISGNAAVSSEYPLKELIVERQRLPREEWYERENMANALKMLEIFPGKLRNTDKNTIYQLITCPIDADRPFMIEYWGECAEAIIEGRDISVPNFGMKTLESCEKQYKALDLYNIMCTRFGMKNFCENFQDEVIRQISILLQKTWRWFDRQTEKN